MSLLTAGFPHLDGVVSALTPAYRDEILFRCRTERDQGTRLFADAARDRDARWTVLSGPRRESGMSPVFTTLAGLQVFVEVAATEDDALLVAHALAEGIMTTAITTDWRGVVATTGLLAVAVAEDEPTYTRVIADGAEVPHGLIVTIPFLIRHGSC